MKKAVFLLLGTLVAVVVPGAAQPVQAKTKVGVFFGAGDCCWHDPYWGPAHWRSAYSYPYPPYYPPQVVYAPPPAVVVAPPPVVYEAPMRVESSIPADQTSPTFTDGAGHTCRAYATTAVDAGGVGHRMQGTACLDGDGVWRVVN